MKCLLVSCFLAILFCTSSYAADMLASIALSPDYQGEGSEFILSWDATLGKSYVVEAATGLGGDWTQLNAEPIVAQSDTETWADQTTDPVKFYRIRKLDTEPPEVVYLNPDDGAIAVGRQESLNIHLADQTDVDAATVALSVGSATAVGVDDPRLDYSDGVLNYTPGQDEYYGDFAETVTISLSVSDTLGYRLENYTWSFTLELEPILAGNVLIIDETSHLTLLSIDGDTYTFSYTGDSPGVSVGDILASTDVANPYKAKVVTVTDHPASHTIDVLTESVPLAELFEQGSLRARTSSAQEQPQQLSPKGHSPTELIVASIPLDGVIIYQDAILTVEVTSGFIEFIPDVTVGAEFGWFRLKSFDAEATGTLNFNASVRATAGKSIAHEKERNLKTFTKSYFTMVGMVPVLVDVVLEFNIGFTAEAEAAGWVESGVRFSRSLTLGAKWRNGSDGKWYKVKRESGYLLPVTPTWQIEGGLNLKPYVEAKLTAYLQKLGGPSLNLKPYVELDGYFQLNPFAYEWGLYAGLTSDLAIELRGWDDDWGELPSWRLLDLRWTIREDAYPGDWVGPISWNKTFGGPDYEAGWSGQQTSDGGYIVAGVTGTGPQCDVFLLKTNPLGDEQWSKSFGGVNEDKGWSVHQTTDDGYIVTGWTKSFGAGKDDIYLIKTDSYGNLQWTKTFGGTDRDFAYCVRQTSDGGFVLAGWTEGPGAAAQDAYLIKTDAQGNEVWSKMFGGPADDQANCVRQTSDGGYILSGWTRSFGAGVLDAYLVKTDAQGNEEWSRTFGGANIDYAYSVSETLDGGYVITGYTASFGAGGNDVYLIKTDRNGWAYWAKTFGGPDLDEGYSVQQTPDRGYIVAGYTHGSEAPSGAAYLIKTDRNGTAQWSRIVGADSHSCAFSVDQTSDGGYVLAGNRNNDVWLVKTDESGLAPEPEW